MQTNLKRLCKKITIIDNLIINDDKLCVGRDFSPFVYSSGFFIFGV